MHRFVIFSRGRSGTTVMTDELGMHPQIAVPIDVDHHEGLYWNLLEPFAAQTPRRRDRGFLRVAAE